MHIAHLLDWAAFADLVVAVYRCNLQSIWHCRWLGNLKHSKYREANLSNWSTLLKLSSDSSGGHQDFLKGFAVNLWFPLDNSFVLGVIFFHLTFLTSSSSISRCCLTSSEDEGVCKDWSWQLIESKVFLKIFILVDTDPAHHLVKTEQLLLRSEHRNFVVHRWTVKSLHEVIRDSTRLKPTQA